ncbi:multicopper oxidase family protein [Atopomonas sediminilitoris]|uniref:multicopper oxidase family protein n=1 Tax=Atopomonas sediminilitoris TaxID=2919919 RepID=UPI001F4E032F|nr:multicopper oxidase family protein [Atopomonas sediminilitoris]MCJ8168977.1 multicopper oxidase family protein [Atopomonas sediminilitoris]
MTVSRRQVLLGAAGLSGLGALGAGVGQWLARPALNPDYDYRLTAAPLEIELVPGFKTPALGYGGQAPGQLLRAKQGERIRVRFTNGLDQATTIHWHGIRLPIEMDGVPFVSQLPMLPGETFDYDFVVPDAGSYWYHPHKASGEQLGRGLVGPLIVDEAQPTGFVHERVLVLKNWHVDEQGAFTDFSVPREAARGGTPGRLTTVNGLHLPVIDLPAGEIVRVRLLNLDNTVTYRLALPGLSAMVYALDGNPVAPQPFKEYWLGPGMRIDLAVKAPNTPLKAPLKDGLFRLAEFAVTERSTAMVQADWPKALPSNPVAEPDLQNAERIAFNFEWVGGLSKPKAEGGALNFWQINGVAWDGNDRSCLTRPAARLRLGRSYIFEMRNLSQYQHPIHIHGMTFKVLSSNRKKITPYFTDTYLLGRNESAKVALVADNPGLWMFHCHVIDHMETGLMTAIEVA